MVDKVHNVVVRFKDFTKEQFTQFDELMATNKTKTKQWCYYDQRTQVGMAVIMPKTKTETFDRRLFVRPAMMKYLRKNGLPKPEKLNTQTAWSNLDKFLLIPGVCSVFADDNAEGYLDSVRTANQPVDHGEKTEGQLYREL